jgi:phospholipase/carboxylesterase
MLDTDLIKARVDSGPRLMIALHGLGDSMEGYRWLPEALQLPWLNYLLVNAPDHYYGGFSWYDIYNNPGPGIESSRKSLFDLLDSTRQNGFPTDKTVLLGFSQGCLMALEIGARYPHRLAGIVGISGYANEPEKLALELSPQAREQRFLITHGTLDPLIPIDKVRPQIELLTRAGLKIKWHEFLKPHTIAGEQELAVIREFVQECYVV